MDASTPEAKILATLRHELKTKGVRIETSLDVPSA